MALCGAPGVCAAAPEMTFRLASVSATGACKGACPKAIVADGEIGDSTPEDFVRFVKANIDDRSVRAVVLLNSPGGKVFSSMRFGKMLRAVGAAAIIARSDESTGALRAGSCFSACVYALMGAVKRVAPEASRVGVHRMYSEEGGPDPTGSGAMRKKFADSEMRDILTQYAVKMGVARAVIDFAENTPNEQIQILSTQDMRRWRLASPQF